MPSITDLFVVVLLHRKYFLSNHRILVDYFSQKSIFTNFYRYTCCISLSALFHWPIPVVFFFFQKDSYNCNESNINHCIIGSDLIKKATMMEKLIINGRSAGLNNCNIKFIPTDCGFQCIQFHGLKFKLY